MSAAMRRSIFSAAGPRPLFKPTANKMKSTPSSVASPVSPPDDPSKSKTDGNPVQGKHIEVATDAFEKMNKRQQLALFAAAGLKAGPNVSLAYAVDKFRREKIREILLYIFFLSLFTVSALVQRDVTEAHYYTQTITNVIMSQDFPGVTWRKTFSDVSVDSDFWEFMVSVIPPFLYAEQWYNGQPFTPQELNYVLHVNRLVQAPRIRQLRVNQELCNVPPRLQNDIKYCYPAFDPSVENTTAIPGWPPGQLLEYQTADQLRTGEYRNGLFPYSGGGFAIDIPLFFNRSQVDGLFSYLRSRRWTDLHTRAVFFDFALYNPVNGLFLSVRLLFEFLPYGQVLPSSQLRAIRMGLSSFNDYAALLLDACVYLLVIFYIVSDCKKILALGRNYWSHFWHWFNWANYIIFAITLVFKINFLIPSYQYVNGSGDLDLQYASLDFESLGWTYYQIVNWNAFNNIFVWLRAFAFMKYISKEVANLSYTLSKAAKDCALFLIIFAIVIFAYAQAFHISFGTDINDYSTLLDSIFGLFKTLLGDFDFAAIQNVNAVLGPLLFITFEVVCYFIMLNMFLAILNKAYSDVMEKGVDDPMAVEFRTTLAENFSKLKDYILHFGKKAKPEATNKDDDDSDPLDESKKGDVDEEALQMMLSTIKQLSMTVKGLSEKIEIVSKAQAVNAPAAKLQLAGRAKTETASRPSSSTVREASILKAPLQVTLELQEVMGDDVTSTISLPNEKILQATSEAGVVEPDDRGKRKAVVPPPSQIAKYSPPTEIQRTPVMKVGSKTVLPPGWKQFANEEGSPYFHNSTTKKTQWDPPVVSKTSSVSKEEECVDDGATPRLL